MDRKRDTVRKENKANKKFKHKIVRKNLYSLLGLNVPISAIVKHRFIHSTNENKKPILLTDCVVDNDIHADHFWAKLNDSDREKLLLTPNNSRVEFTCEIHLYTSRQQHESAKIGIQCLKLTKE